MNETVKPTDIDSLTEQAEAAVPSTIPAPVINKLIRGRMPLPLVWNIRFVELVAKPAADGEEVVPITDSSVANKYFTTPGKIMDIRKNANFKYITADTTFNEVDIDAGKAQLVKNVNDGKKRGATEASHDFTMDDAAPLFAILESLVSETSSVDGDKAAYLEKNPRSNAKKEGVTAEVAEGGTDEEAPTEAEETELDSELDELMG